MLLARCASTIRPAVARLRRVSLWAFASIAFASPLSAAATDAAAAANDAVRAAIGRQPHHDLAAVDLRLQGRRYTAEQSREAASAILEVPAVHTLLIGNDGRFRFHTHTHYPGAIEFQFLTVGTPQGSATIDPMQWRDGTEISRDPAQSAREDYADLMFLSPALLLQDVLAREAATAVTAAADGKQTIAFKDAAGRAASLVLDTRTGTVAALTSGDNRYVFANYRSVHDLLQPKRIEQYRAGKPVAAWDEVEAKAVAAPSADKFVLPPGYVDAAPRGELRATPLGAGAYRIDGAPAGYHTGFVAGDKAIAVFDAPIGVEPAAKVRAAIERAAPGRKIAYVVLSHAHGDHVAGLPAYLGDGVEVIAGNHAGIALRRQLGDKAPAHLTELTAPRRLDLGGVELRLFPLDSTHSETMLVGYAPQSRTLFQGDLFYLPEVGPVPAAFEGGEELARLIAAQKLDVARIVGAHGRSGGPGDLAESLRLRHQAQANAQR